MDRQWCRVFGHLMAEEELHDTSPVYTNLLSPWAGRSPSVQHAFYQDRFAALSMTAFLFLIAIVLYRARSAVRSALEICPSRGERADMSKNSGGTEMTKAAQTYGKSGEHFPSCRGRSLVFNGCPDFFDIHERREAIPLRIRCVQSQLPRACYF